MPLNEIPDQEDPFEKVLKVEKLKLKKKGNLKTLEESKRGEGDIVMRFQWHEFHKLDGQPNLMPFTIFDEAFGKGARPLWWYILE